MNSEVKEVKYTKPAEWKSTVIEEKTNELRLKIERQPYQEPSEEHQKQPLLQEDEQSMTIELDSKQVDSSGNEIYQEEVKIEEISSEVNEEEQVQVEEQTKHQQDEEVRLDNEAIESNHSSTKQSQLLSNEAMNCEDNSRTEKDDDWEMQSSNNDDEQNREEVEEKEKVEDDAESKEKLDVQDQDIDDNKSHLGRNRRVRQKNKWLYGTEFHTYTSSITKGAREEFEDSTLATSATTTSTRSSNRRATSDSNPGNQDEPEHEKKYCRKCSAKTSHDIESGCCQNCVLKKIEEDKKRKLSSQRNRSHNSRQSSQQQQLDSNKSSSNTNVTSQSNKRKATKQGGSRTNSSGSGSSNNNINAFTTNTNNNNIINSPTIDKSTLIQKDSPKTTIADPLTSKVSTITNASDTTTTTTITPKATISSSECYEGDLEQNDCNKLPSLDSWTSDEVAEYISSRGFVDEAELFKKQCVDGISLLLMQRTDFTYGLKMKLGPALKIYDQVCKLKKDYLRATFP